MFGLRRQSPVLGLALAWLIALGGLLGGLSLAKTLPRAHAEALAAASLCLPGEDGAPAKQHPAGHTPDCVLCRGPVVAFAAPGLSPALVLIAEAFRQPLTIAFEPARDRPLTGSADSRAHARGPPLTRV